MKGYPNIDRGKKRYPTFRYQRFPLHFFGLVLDLLLQGIDSTPTLRRHPHPHWTSPTRSTHLPSYFHPLSREDFPRYPSPTTSFCDSVRDPSPSVLYGTPDPVSSYPHSYSRNSTLLLALLLMLSSSPRTSVPLRLSQTHPPFAPSTNVVRR